MIRYLLDAALVPRPLVGLARVSQHGSSSYFYIDRCNKAPLPILSPIFYAMRRAYHILGRSFAANWP